MSMLLSELLRCSDSVGLVRDSSPPHVRSDFGYVTSSSGTCYYKSAGLLEADPECTFIEIIFIACIWAQKDKSIMACC
jgi:hypothetical protein